MRGTSVIWIAVLIASLGCETPAGSSSGSDSKPRRSSKSSRTVDGLVETKIDMPGVLFIREDHGIGGYDAFVIPPVAVNYKRTSKRLSQELENELKTLLRDSLTDGATRSGVPIQEKPSKCAMQIGLALYNVSIARRSDTESLGEMTLVMEFRDSISGQPLLRYATKSRIENRPGGGNRVRQLRKGFDRMVAQMDLRNALVAAGLDDKARRPGCEGLMAKLTQEASQPVSSPPRSRGYLVP